MEKMRASINIIFVIFISLNNCYNLHFCLARNVTMQMLEDFGTRTNTASSGEVSETQYATCRITTEELVANAEATITRVLTGMCNSEMVKERFSNLERMLTREFDEIKRTLNTLVAQNNDARNLYTNNRYETTNDLMVDPRQDEINRFNSTIHEQHTSAGQVRVFTYYFCIDNFIDKIRNLMASNDGSIRSSTFYVSPRSYAMYLKVTLRHNVVEDAADPPQTYVNFGAGVTRGRYDETLEWPFPLKQQVEILDHSNRGLHRRQDFTSQIMIPSNSTDTDFWRKPSSGSGVRQGRTDNPEWVGLAVPTDALLRSGFAQFSSPLTWTSKYLWQGHLTVKLTAFLPDCSPRFQYLHNQMGIALAKDLILNKYFTIIRKKLLYLNFGKADI